MLFDTEYKTVSGKTESIFKDRGSKFIGICKPISSVEEFKEFLQTTKTDYPQAVHYCYAYRIGYDKTNFRINDDGEPSGTAGRPIYNVIQSYDLTDIGIIVVRYFGGTLLGVPGLINAYKNSSLEAVKANEIIIKQITQKIEIEFEFNKMNESMKIIKEYKLKILSQQTDTNYKISIELPIKNAEQIYSALKNYNISYRFI